MKQVLIRHGQAVVEEVPAPLVESGTLLVQVAQSCISIGTEMSGVRASGLPLWKRALNQPQNVRTVFQMVASQGLLKTKSLVQGKLSCGQPTGYSAAGTVIEVGKGVDGIKVGDRVACAGAQCAHHAELIRVPRNLAVLVPENVSFPDASTVTLGAIAMQGVRRASPTLGESFVVVGLGILGQLTVQILRASGCRVIGIDLDRKRIDLATQMGMNVGLHPEDVDDIQQVARLTNGHGADAVIITAASPSDSIISSAFRMCRKKGRVVLVGDVGLNLNRADFYSKEIDFFISTSYGPGRYDNNYEEKGLDYPIAYVRWTENRNMGEFLQLIADGIVNVEPLIASSFTIDQAPVAYEALKADDNKPLMVLLSYPEESASRYSRVTHIPTVVPAKVGKLRIAVVGAGGFAKGTHLPNLQSLSDKYEIHCIMSRTGHNALETAKQFSASYATTDYCKVLDDKDVDAVVIASRHNLHSEMLLAALRAGKHVLVEKPLALTAADLDRIESFYSDESIVCKPLTLTGFNRRFSPYAQRIHSVIGQRSNPMIINYRMNAGYIPLDHWVHNEEGGGRNLGEACHIYDLFTFLVNARAVHVTATSIRPSTAYYSSSDNFVASIFFGDGSVANLTYTSMGSGEYPKESMEIFVDGKTIVLDDYKKLSILGTRQKPFSTAVQDKGQYSELISFANGVRDGIWPIPLWQQIQATRISLQVEQFLTPERLVS